jgi:hypothetical protein
VASDLPQLGAPPVVDVLSCDLTFHFSSGGDDSCSGIGVEVGCGGGSFSGDVDRLELAP